MVSDCNGTAYSVSYTRDKLGRITEKVETLGLTTATAACEYDVSVSPDRKGCAA